MLHPANVIWLRADRYTQCTPVRASSDSGLCLISSKPLWKIRTVRGIHDRFASSSVPSERRNKSLTLKCVSIFTGTMAARQPSSNITQKLVLQKSTRIPVIDFSIPIVAFMWAVSSLTEIRFPVADGNSDFRGQNVRMCNNVAANVQRNSPSLRRTSDHELVLKGQYSEAVRTIRR